MLTVAIAAIALSPLTGLLVSQDAPAAGAEPIQLGRIFKQGQKFSYEVRSSLEAESRQFGLDTFLPQSLDINYRFTMEVQQMKADGIAQILYERPTMTQIEGETYEAGPKTRVERTNVKLQLDLSPINEILNVRDLNPSRPQPAKPAQSLRVLNLQPPAEIPVVGQFVQELYRLSLFIGTLDSGIDFSPKLPYDVVTPGETWKRTVGYQPQRRAQGEGIAVQRLDYTFTYIGVVESAGKRVHRVTATLGLDTDAAPMLNQMTEGGEAVTGLRQVELKLTAKIEYDLDLETMHTIAANAESTGSIRVFVTQLGAEPAMEERLKGRTTLRLLSMK